MNWSTSRDTNTAVPVSPPIGDPRDLLTQDQVLFTWQQLKEQLAKAKEAELEYRKYVVKRAFPQATEGTNTVELNNGYALKAVVKHNYKLLNNEVVENCLDRIAKIGNQGSFIADRLVSWSPSFLLTEYRALQKEDTEETKEILKICHEMLIIDEAAPTVDIKAPKGKK